MQLLKLVLSSIDVCVEQMRKNLDISDDLIFSEGVMLALAKTLGKNQAQKIVFEEAKLAREKRISFKESLLNNSKITSNLDAKSIEEIFNFKNRLGLCSSMVDKVMDQI